MPRPVAIMVSLLLLAAACAVPGDPWSPVSSSHDPGPPPADGIDPPLLAVSWGADGPAPAALPAPPPDNQAMGGPEDVACVRLLGSEEVHRTGCPKVLRADPQGIVPCALVDGPRCPLCLYDGPNPDGH